MIVEIVTESRTIYLSTINDELINLCIAVDFIKERINELKIPPANVWYKKGDYELPTETKVFFAFKSEEREIYFSSFTENLSSDYTHFLIPKI